MARAGGSSGAHPRWGEQHAGWLAGWPWLRLAGLDIWLAPTPGYPSPAAGIATPCQAVVAGGVGCYLLLQPPRQHSHDLAVLLRVKCSIRNLCRWGQRARK